MTYTTIIGDSNMGALWKIFNFAQVFSWNRVKHWHFSALRFLLIISGKNMPLDWNRYNHSSTRLIKSMFFYRLNANSLRKLPPKLSTLHLARKSINEPRAKTNLLMNYGKRSLLSIYWCTRLPFSTDNLISRV